MSPTARDFLLIAGLSGALAVLLGAFGAHGLKGRLEPRLLAAYQTGVEYQFYHTAALLAVGLLWERMGGSALGIAGYGFSIGILLFSGSLYALALTGISKLGIITPIGGLVLLGSWLSFAWAALRSAPQP